MSKIEVNGVNLWHRISGEGEPVVHIHGSGFGHFNFDPLTPIVAESFQVIDYDQRGYGQSDRPHQDYNMEVWADDVAGLMDALGHETAHIHGSSMGGMVALVFAGKYPDRVRSVIINCAAVKLNSLGRMMFKNYIDLVDLDPAGMGGRVLAELMAWQAHSASFLASPAGAEAPDHIQQILRDSNDPEVFKTVNRYLLEMDLSPWIPKVTAPALVIGGAEDIMTPWDQSPDGIGQNEIAEGIKHSEKHVLEGSAHSSIFDATEPYSEVVMDFLNRHKTEAAA